ncbi:MULTISPECIES: alpha/beta fold hydrolase [unclassified Micromonospora]|uniref:alpha/beta fold hydrolase n=1 Tax=unclassified Micromonospora TaxID=2617518 RepID=UPI001C5DE773|nr:alpha/beta hydrolase [Micromonospora sp. RL09-050-HVF-A]MBW4701252.1 alpha/beta hydrolase [Micromonospora sp. RL09-050-HVF-A]
MTREGEPGPRYAHRADNKRVAYEESGAPDGFPVFLMHGTPGSRRGPKPRGIVLYRMGIRLIAYDRPGYGDSDRFEGRDVADAARDVEAIADQLRLGRFAVAGRSGGGPHALACAADERLRGRVSRVAVLVSFAPSEAIGLDWFDGMNRDNQRGFGDGRHDTEIVVEEIRQRAARAAEDPRFLLRELMTQMGPPDRRAINDAALRGIIFDTYQEALRAGPYGWIDDVLALRRDWKFDLDAIDTTVTPVRLWHGEEDTFAPASHGRWLAARIPGAEIEVQPGAAHFDAMQQLPRMLRWLVDGQAPTGTDVLIGARPGQ